MRLRLDLGYDGSGFHGWAAQPGLRTVEGTLRDAICRILRTEQPPALVVAGRTDAGVHARGQVVHVDVDEGGYAALPGRSARTPAESLCARLAGVLPPDVVVRRARPVQPAFDARFSALGRTYTYRLVDTPHPPDPLLRAFVAWVRHELDVAAMRRAAATLTGEHDFIAYCRPRVGASTVRNLRRLDVQRSDDGLVLVELEADAFCHNQVRALVGALTAVGQDQRPESWPTDVLRAGTRDGSVQVSPPHGLTLERVSYPPEDQLAARAATTRALRGPAR